MGRLLVIELLEASNISQNMRHIKGLTVKPYIKARCPDTDQQEKQTSVAEGSHESSTWRWERSLLLPLQPVRVQREVVELSLFIKRTVKGDKLLATLEVPVADFAAVDGNNASASEDDQGTRTYEMKFVKAKFGDRNGGTQITMKICARVENNAPPIPPRPRPVPDSSAKILHATGVVISAIGVIAGVEELVLPDGGNEEYDDEENDDEETYDDRNADGR